MKKHVKLAALMLRKLNIRSSSKACIPPEGAFFYISGILL